MVSCVINASRICITVYDNHTSHAQRQTGDLQPEETVAAARSLVALAQHFWGLQEATEPASAA